MIGNDPGYQAWMQTVRQQQAQYDAQIRQAQDALSYIAAPQSPASYGYTPMANALTRLAGAPNNASTGLLQPTNPFNFALMRYMMEAPGGNTIGLPSDSAPDANQSPQLIAALLGRSGVG